jgi:ADP-heptose:LPS heptosyltransferase
MMDRLTTELGMAPRKIAVLRALQLGDVLVAVPALRALRAAHPQAEITFIGLPWARDFVRRFAHLVNDFLEFPGFPGLTEREFNACGFSQFVAAARQSRFDAAIQLHGSGLLTNRVIATSGARRSAGFHPAGQLPPDNGLYMQYPDTGHEIRRNLSLMSFLGIPMQGEYLEFPVTEADRHEASQVLGDCVTNRIVCVHAGARFKTRRWPAHRFACVADALARDGFTVVLTGSWAESELVGQVSAAMTAKHLNVVGRTSLGGLAALLKTAQLVVTNDTGVSHVAAAVGTRSVVIVMGSDPERWAPLDHERHTVLFQPVGCRPCSYDICPIGHPCAAAVTVASVIDAARRQLRRESALIHAPSRRPVDSVCSA